MTCLQLQYRIPYIISPCNVLYGSELQAMHGKMVIAKANQSAFRILLWLPGSLLGYRDSLFSFMMGRLFLHGLVWPVAASRITPVMWLTGFNTPNCMQEYNQWAKQENHDLPS